MAKAKRRREAVTAELRISACDGKKKFLTWAQAQTAAGRKRGREVYHCRYCNHFHVGRKKPWT